MVTKTWLEPAKTHLLGSMIKCAGLDGHYQIVRSYLENGQYQNLLTIRQNRRKN